MATNLAEADPQVVRAPVHIAIIMDGNRRWARSRGLPAVAGHKQGASSVRHAIEGSVRLGVRYLTLYAFSSENWARPEDEVGELMNLLRYYLRREIKSLSENGVRVRVIGDRARLAPDIRDLIAGAEAQTAGNSRLTLVVALSYGGRDEIVSAARRLAAEAQAGRLAPDTIDEAMMGERLYTAGIPDPDLLIRTSGEKRISNFLLWQLAYAEMVFLDVPWPEFGEEHLRAAVVEYCRRERRYGANGG